MRRTTAVLTGLVFGAAPASASAQTAGGAVTSFGAGEWFGLMLRLGLVVGVIWAAVYAMRWYTQRAGAGRAFTARALDIVETRPLGPNRALHLVRIGGRAVLIGVTPERINALLEIDDPEVLAGLELVGSASRPAGGFGALLAGFGAASKSAPAEEPEASPDAASRLGLGLCHLQRFLASASPRADSPLVERVLAVLGFTPVGPVALGAQRIDADRRIEVAAPAAATPMPRGTSTSRVAGRAPSVNALRARSGYQVAAESSRLEDGQSDRDARIAEAQRAIAAALRKAG